MPVTPESKVKAKCKRLIDKFGEDVESHWPVVGAMGAPSLDCNMIVNGYAFSMECKAPTEKPTKRQWLTIDKKVRANGFVIVCDGSEFTYIDLVSVIGYLLSHDTAEAHSLCNRNLGEFR